MRKGMDKFGNGRVDPRCIMQCDAYVELVAERDNLLQAMHKIAQCVGVKQGETWSTLAVVGAVQSLTKNSNRRPTDED